MKRQTVYSRYAVSKASGILPPPDKKEDWRIIYFDNDREAGTLFVVWECWTEDGN